MDMHHICLRIMSCICFGVVHVLIVVSICFLSIEFRKRSECEDSFDYVPLVYFTDRMLHRFVLLPSGISGKMIISLDTITIIAMLDVSFLSLVSLPTTCMSSLPTLPWKASNPPPHPNKPLFGYVTACSALLIALLVAGASSSMCNMDIFDISQYYCYLI